jgi:hypothetical protein
LTRGHSAALHLPPPGNCPVNGRDISPDLSPDDSRPLRDRLAGLRRFFDEPLASRKNLTKLRGRACPCLKIQTSDKRLRRDVKIVAPNFSHFVNATVQIDDAIRDMKLNVTDFLFLQVRRAQSDCRG